MTNDLWDYSDGEDDGGGNWEVGSQHGSQPSQDDLGKGKRKRGKGQPAAKKGVTPAPNVISIDDDDDEDGAPSDDDDLPLLKKKPATRAAAAATPAAGGSRPGAGGASGAAAATAAAKQAPGKADQKPEMTFLSEEARKLLTSRTVRPPNSLLSSPDVDDGPGPAGTRTGAAALGVMRAGRRTAHMLGYGRPGAGAAGAEVRVVDDDGEDLTADDVHAAGSGAGGSGHHSSLLSEPAASGRGAAAGAGPSFGGTATAGEAAAGGAGAGAGADKNAGKIVLVCRWGEGSSKEIKLRVRPSDALSKLMQAFKTQAAGKGVAGTTGAKFMFDGDNLDGDGSAEDLGMEDGDIIDVRLG